MYKMRRHTPPQGSHVMMEVDWSHAATSQGTPEVSSNATAKNRGVGQFLSQSLCKESADTLISDFWSPTL